MKKAKWVAPGILLMLAVSPPTMAATTFKPTTGVDYVIRNVETGLFLRCSMYSKNSAYFGSEIEGNYYLWQFTASGDGWKLYNEGRGGYLNNDPTSSTYRGKTDATGVTWYITTNTLNPSGYLISTSNTTTTQNSLYAYRDASSYYLCSTEGEGVDLGPHGATNYYQLPTFQFYTYHELYALAKKCGYTGNEETNPSTADWTKLTNQIEAARLVTDKSVAVSVTDEKSTGYVIASRRYHKFLYTDIKGIFHTADHITTSSIFNITPGDNGARVISSAYHGADKTLTLYYANNGHDNDFKLKKGDYFLCVGNDGKVKYSKLELTGKLTDKQDDNKDLCQLDDEWVMKATPYDTDDKLPSLNINKTDISSNKVKSWFFRIENNAKRIKFIKNATSDDDTGKDNTGGFLNDVDKEAAATYDGVKKTKISKVDMFSNSTNLRDAANIWHVTLAVPGKENDDNPIGIVGNFPYSLYYIQNANSGKYIGEPSGTSQVMPLISETTDKKERALFYFMPKDTAQDAGEYAMMLLDKTNSTTTETPKGWLDIADTGDDGRPLDTAVPNLVQAALIYRPSTTVPETTSDAYNWSLHRARYVEARTAESAKFHTYRYVTLWFPFDVLNTDNNNVTLYTAQWKTDYSGIVLNRIGDGETLKGGHGALALITDNDKYKTVKFELPDRDEITYPSNIDKNILKGICESEDYILGDEDNTTTGVKSRYDVYVFSVTLNEKDADGKYKDTEELMLGNPADSYLMANRCYVKAPDALKKSSSTTGALSVSFDSDNTDGITVVTPRQQGPQRYFDLQGREVSHPQHGIYITNGKKIFLK